MATLINEACNDQVSGVKNIGSKDQCFEGLVKTSWLADEDFAFSSVEAMRTTLSAIQGIKEGDIKPLPLIESIEPNNTDANIKNGAWRDYTLKDAIPGVKYRIDTAICTHAALKTYRNSRFSSRIFEITTEDEILCEVQEDGTVKGRKMTSFEVGLRNQRTADDVPYTDITIKYDNDTPSVIKASYDVTELEGIYDVTLVQDSATVTEIKFKVVSDCSGDVVSAMEQADFIVKDADGAVQSIAGFTEADSNGVCAISGTGFATGFTVELNGVAEQGKLYESQEPLRITV